MNDQTEEASTPKTDVARLDMEKRQRHAGLLSRVAHTFDTLYQTYGDEPLGVGWSTNAVHDTAIASLLDIVDKEGRDDVCLNDFGCGYGRLFSMVCDQPWFRRGRYYAYDVSESMVQSLLAKYGNDRRVHAVQSMDPLWKADYSLVAGTFNCCMSADREEWLRLIQNSLKQLWEKSRYGMAVNFLHSDWTRKDPDLLYMEPEEMERFCKTNFTENLQMLYDIPPGQFGLLMHR